MHNIRKKELPGERAAPCALCMFFVVGDAIAVTAASICVGTADTFGAFFLLPYDVPSSAAHNQGNHSYHNQIGHGKTSLFTG